MSCDWNVTEQTKLEKKKVKNEGIMKQSTEECERLKAKRTEVHSTIPTLIQELQVLDLREMIAQLQTLH